MLVNYFNQHDPLDKPSFRFHVHILTSCYNFFNPYGNQVVHPLKRSDHIEAIECQTEFPFLCYLLLEYQSDSFVFQNCMYYIHHYTALKKHSIYIHRYGDPLLRSCVRAHWKSNWPILELMIFISRREKEKERNILKDFDIDLSADLFIPVIATLIDFHNFWLYHYTGVNYN